MTKNLYLFVGRSATGKTTIVSEVCERLGLSAVSSYTDRPKRYPGEEGHIFLSKEGFDALPDKLACAKFAGHRYCTTKSILDVCDCFVIEPKGLRELKQMYDTRPIVVIGIYAPMRTIVDRMRGRGDSEDQIKVRLDHDEIAFGMMDELCDVVFVNRDLVSTASDVISYIKHRESD